MPIKWRTIISLLVHKIPGLFSVMIFEAFFVGNTHWPSRRANGFVVCSMDVLNCRFAGVAVDLRVHVTILYRTNP